MAGRNYRNVNKKMGCHRLTYFSDFSFKDLTNDIPVLVYEANVVTYADFSSFGALLDWRHGGEITARGYQGSLKDDDIKAGEGNSYSTEFRQLDPRLGRWLSIDPRTSELVSVSPYLSMNNNPILLNDPDGDFVPLITGLIGAAAGAVYGVVTGKSGKQIAALAAGGFVAGATLGIGTLAVATAGGVAALSAAGTTYVMGGSAIAGGILGNITEQSINNIGTNKSIDKDEALISGVYAIPDGLAGGAVGHASEEVGKGLSRYFKRKLSKETSGSVLKEFKNDIAKDLRKQGAGRRLANKVANKAVKKYENNLKDGFQSKLVGVKITKKAAEVTLSSVQIGAIETVKEKSK